MGTLRVLSACALLATVVAASEVAAQGSNLAFVYAVEVHSGQEMAFESAFKEHMSFREEQGEPFVWQVYQEMFGDNPGTYYIRSGDHSWADMDDYGTPDFQQSVGNHFGATIAPLIADVRSQVTVTDTANSHRPPNLADMNVFMVTQVFVDAEAQIGMDEALTAFHETATTHDRYHGILRTLAGGEGADFTIVVYAEDFAGLEEESPSLTELMVQAHGQDGFREIAESYLSGVDEMRTSILMLRRDLSSGAGS